MGETPVGKGVTQLPKDDNGNLNSCRLYALMHNFADEYHVLGLKTYSLQRFEAACATNLNDTLHSCVIELVFVDHQ
jgi:hypothetical protein